MRASVTQAVTAAAIGLAIGSNAQPAPTPQFDVASVKRTTTEQGPRGISFSPSGRFGWNRMTLRQLMTSAFAGLDTKAIVGGPEWIDSARFDIAATSVDALNDIGPGGEPRGVFLRLRGLLEERFALKTHVESRAIPVYALEPAAAVFAAGPGLKPVDVDCDAVVREMAAAGRQAVPEGQLPRCSMRNGPGRFVGRAITMTMLADALSSSVERPVIDRTGLARTFDVELTWAPDLPPGTLINGATPPPNDGPSIFTAVREQLGLRLDATRASVPVLVIDAAQLPTPD